MSGRVIKSIIGASAILIIVVGCSVGLGRALDNDDAEEKVMQIRMEDIRELMKDHGIQAYIVQPVDEHQSEYISMRDRRRQYITGFSGSAGTAIITDRSAALWTDSRYFLQAEMELDQEYWTLMKQGQAGVLSQEDWLMKELPPNSKVGTDPFLMTSTEFERLSKVLSQSGHTLIGLSTNLVDAVWNTRPELDFSEIEIHELEYSGKKIGDKVKQIQDELDKHGAGAIVITALDEIAWLLNLRGSDIIYNPVFYAYVLLTKSNLHLFIHGNRMNNRILSHFLDEGAQVVVRDYNDILTELRSYENSNPEKIIVSTAASYAIYSAISADKRIQLYSIVALIKTIKNTVEAEGLRKAHVRDGAALALYFHWLEENIGKIRITELSGANRLKEFRSEQDLYKGLSFTAISAAGANAAIVHYSPTEATDKEITSSEVYLIDSGGQYLDGTTDVTRTMHFGEPTEFQKECFTRVLKGYLALRTAVFPPRTSGAVFDTLARKYLWDIGLDYGHGTGHGIGSYMNVHEYPPLFSQSADPTNNAQENFFVSNEPGYYHDGEFGIRIEDIVQMVKLTNSRFDFGGRGVMGFNTMTLAPIQAKMIKLSMLSWEELEVINQYHARIREEVGNLLLEKDHNDTYIWLVKQTAPIKM